jgi:hypothetical protein
MHLVSLLFFSFTCTVQVQDGYQTADAEVLLFGCTRGY